MRPRSVPLWLVGAGIAAGAPLYQPPRVGILLQFEHPPAPTFVKQFSRHVDRLFQPTGLDLRWEVLDGRKKPGVYDGVVVVRMQGQCADRRVYEVIPQEARRVKLGWTMVNDGEVIAHSVVDCDEVARTVLSFRSASRERNLLPLLFVRLAARVLGHELIHALLRTAEHRDTDLGREKLLAHELEVDARLKLEEVTALRQLGRPTLQMNAGDRNRR